MSGLDAFILGIVQGLTEFLPISSSGHLILTGKLLGVAHMPLAFELVTHLATLLAVVMVLRKPLFALIKRPFQKKTALLLTATVPTVLIFLLFQSVFKASFDGRYLLYCFGFTALLIIAASAVRRKNPKTLPGFLDAALIGVAQGLAGFPGISRSGATICTARLTGTDKKESAEFSFLLGIPIILGSFLWELFGGGSFGNVAPLPLVIGFFTAFIVGFFCAVFMLRFIAKGNMTGFAAYLCILTLFLIVDKFALHLF
ncbi:MAG: undecaprenyl-diphosphate phosphatase [Firmicutes bacterium]|nr:undecaprenyl-diphosphate phosphatase [Bacillota bacterium]